MDMKTSNRIDSSTATDPLEAAPAHFLLFETRDGIWKAVAGSPGIDLSRRPLAIEKDSFQQDAYISTRDFEGIFGALFPHGLPRQLVEARRFHCTSMKGLIPQKSILVVGDRSFLGFSRARRRQISKTLYQQHMARIKSEQAALLERIGDFTTKYFDGQRDVVNMLGEVSSLLECRALSLWLYNKRTKTYTLYGTNGIDPSLYRRDWFSHKHKSLVNTLVRQEEDVIRFRPNPKKSANPEVAALFDFGYLCKLRSQASGSLLGVLVVYEPPEYPLLDQEDRIRLVGAGVREHLIDFRATNRNKGIQVVSDFVSKAVTASLEESMDFLCLALVRRLNIGGCSVLLAEDRTPNEIRLISTSDKQESTFTERYPDRSWRSFCYKRGQGLTGSVLKSNEMRLVYDLPAHEHENTHVYDEIAPGPRKSWIGIPIHCPGEDEAVGVLRAVNKLITRSDEVVPWHFQGSDVETLTTVATIIGYLSHNRRLQQESERRLADAQQERDEKSRFLDSLSHEIIAPLQSIKNVIATIKRNPTVSDAMSERLKFFMEGATNQCYQMEMIVTNIASLDDPGIMEPSVVDIVTSIIHPVVNMFRLLAQVDKDVHVTFDERLRSCPPVFADARAAEQILFVLLDNAFKYCNDHTIISIDGQEDRFHDKFLLTVSDYGLPVPEGWKERVFERGVRAPNVTEQLLRGSGLGLTIARGLAEALGGGLWISRTDNPVEVTFELPLAKEK